MSDILKPELLLTDRLIITADFIDFTRQASISLVLVEGGVYAVNIRLDSRLERQLVVGTSIKDALMTFGEAIEEFWFRLNSDVA